MLALVLLGPAAVATAGGRDVLADAQDGRVDACYSRADFRDGMRLARADQRLYGFALDAIKAAGISRVRSADRPCGAAIAPAHAAPVDSGGWRGLWGAVAGAVVVLSAGAGALARRAARGRG